MGQILPAVIWYGTSSLWLIMLEEGLRRQIWKVVTDLRLTASCSDRGIQFGIWWFPICTVSYLSRGQGNSESDDGDGVIIRSEETPDESSWPWGGPGKGSPGSKKQCISCARIAFPSFLLSLNFLLLFQFTNLRLCVRVRCLLFVVCILWLCMKHEWRRRARDYATFVQTFYLWSLNSLSGLSTTGNVHCTVQLIFSALDLDPPPQQIILYCAVQCSVQ